MDFSEALTRLYGAAHADFVEERKALASQLRAAGETALARRIAKRTRPPIVVWVVNQLAQQVPESLMEALKAIDAERDAQLEVLAGAPADTMRDARAASRQAMATARTAMAKLLEEGGHAPSKNNLERALEVLRHGALDAELRPDLEAGLLSGPPEPPDLGDVAQQLDPALLRAALQKKPARKPKRGVDSFMAKAVRGKRGRASASQEAPSPAAPIGPGARPPAAETPTRRASSPSAQKIAAIEAELDLRRTEAEAKAADVERLTAELDQAREELRRARRRAGDLKERLQTLRRRARSAT